MQKAIDVKDLDGGVDVFKAARNKTCKLQMVSEYLIFSISVLYTIARNH